MKFAVVKMTLPPPPDTHGVKREAVRRGEERRVTATEA